jgi:hypothetical protein
MKVLWPDASLERVEALRRSASSEG